VVVERSPDTESVREPAPTGPWLARYQELGARDPAGLDAAELEDLAEAAWWLCRPGESIAARHRAHAAFRRSGGDRGAARTAARLFHDHFYLGEVAVAVGWLGRGFRHVERDPGGVERGWLECGLAELRLHQGPLDQAVEHAAAAVALANRHGDADLAAIGLQLQGRALIAGGGVEDGVALLDEAMTFVLAGELAPLYTGWVYCSVMLACRDLADLRRAGEWTEAARRWCQELPPTTPYSQGLCRIYRGEVLAMRGAWDEAEAELRLAHQELLPHKPRGAAEASYSVGEVLRRRGELAAAERAFVQAQRLGWDPQPGLALLRLAQGRMEAAAAALRSALASPPLVDPFAHTRLLAAQVDIAIAAGALDQAREAAGQLAAVEAALDSPVISATVAGAAGALRLAEGDPAAALERLRRAVAGWRELGLPYEEARARQGAGLALRMLGDEDGGRVELEAARAGFDRLGAAADSRQVGELLHGRRPRGLLTDREVEVLRLVAAGGSNRDIAAALHLSEHTVARHMQNVFAKLGVSSRAAAISRAIEKGQLANDGENAPRRDAGRDG
jgi:DNA-binding CsgD family transcriptional regulator/Flp pilus assembly protein TadD